MRVKGEIFCLSALYPRDNNLKEHLLQLYKAMSELDTLDLHEAIKEPDWKEFITAIVKLVTE